MSSDVKFERCFPYLIVSNLEENIRFFCDRLGFELVDHEAEIDFAIVQRDEVAILLRGSSREPKNLVNTIFDRDSWPEGYEPYDMSIQVSNVEALYAELKENGAEPEYLEEQAYGRDTGVTLPDGYHLVFLQLESKE